MRRIDLGTRARRRRLARPAAWLAATMAMVGVLALPSTGTGAAAAAGATPAATPIVSDDLPVRPPAPAVEARDVTGSPAPAKGDAANVAGDGERILTQEATGAAGTVDVEILVDGAGAAATAKVALAGSGGAVTGEVPGKVVQARVRRTDLANLAGLPGVQQVRPPVDINVIPEAGSVGSEPVGKTLANQWHAAGITGAGVSVGIIDVFESSTWNTAVSRGDLPAGDPRARAFCLAAGQACDIFAAAGRHGNAVAEIVHDMAPGATLYLAYVQTTSDLRAAIDWMAARGVTVINRSQGAPFDGPGNGTGALADVASYATTKGITFFNSAGNAGGGGYWRGGWVDLDGDGFLNFNGADELLAVSVDPCAVALGFRWSDWGPPSTRTDYDVYIDSNHDGVLNGSDVGWEADQRAGALPIEAAGGLLGNCGDGAETVQLGVRLYAAGSGTAGDVLELMVNSASLEYWSTPYSGTQPISDSANPAVVSVGAIDPWNGTTPAYYSSQGPSNDGRTKPDLVAPSCFATVAYGSSCFNGTSAASPVAAGAAALVRQSGLAADAGGVRAFLTASATDRGSPGVDNATGWGEVSLPKLPSGGALGRGKIVPVAPFRLIDTRLGQGEPPGRVAPGNVVKADVLGKGGVPSNGVTAVVVNVTAGDTTYPGYLQVYPYAVGTVAASSNLNADIAHQTVANLTIVPVGLDGKIAVYNQAGSHVIIDVFGYVAETDTSRDGRFLALNPARVLDTRAGGVGQKVAADAVVNVPVAGQGGIPSSGASAVALNLTATQSSGPGFVQVLPGQSGAMWGWSNLNLVGANQTVANLVIVPLDASGNVRLFTTAATHLIVDVMGYVTDASAPREATGLFTPVRPTRLRDSRGEGGPIPPGGRMIVQPGASPAMAGADAGAVLVNVTATQALAPGYVQVYPTGAPVEQQSSNLNLQARGATVPNAAVTALGAGKQFTIFTDRGAHLIADLAGWFAA